VGGDVPVDSNALLMIDFMNLKIKLTQSFKYTHKDRVCMYIFIKMNTHTCISIYIYTMLFKKKFAGRSFA
jgi:hypothetical protein